MQPPPPARPKPGGAMDWGWQKPPPAGDDDLGPGQFTLPTGRNGLVEIVVNRMPRRLGRARTP